MHILIEEYQYAFKDVSIFAPSLEIQHDADGNVSLSRVGYFYSPEVEDCVFVLPKVLLDGEFGNEKVFGHIYPCDLIDFDNCSDVNTAEREFIYNLSVWIYRAISVFKDHEFDRFGGKKKTPSIVLSRQAPISGHSGKRKANTFLDILLALQQWNKDNQQFVTFIVKNMHAGYNRTNWIRTISHSPAIVQDNGSSQSVVYLKPINKKRKINFDEELLVIYYSILYYINDAYGIPVIMNVNFPLIQGEKFKFYLKGYGVRRLREIKYKYFSDKALELWNLCFEFFDRPSQVKLNVDKREYLMVKNFNIVFEAIIDELIAGDQKLPKKLTDQPDGKIVDHLYQYRELVNDFTDKDIYYIGDSKYYKRGNQLGETSVYKQFTYARNVIQWNLDLFNNGTEEEQKGHIKLRDDITEGYNIIPNFFISAQQNDLNKSDKIELSTDKIPFYLTYQFLNRLYDRDTFLLAHYDVNFLFVLALYGRNKKSAKEEWRNKVRKMFRQQIQDMLQQHFDFYVMTAHEDIDAGRYIHDNFQSVLGKVFSPFDGRDGQQYYSLALRNPEKIVLKNKDEEARQRAIVAAENDTILFQLKQSFYVKECPLGDQPYDKVPVVIPKPKVTIPKKLLTLHYIENYPETSFLIGGFREEQKEWMFGQKGGKVDNAYNVRLGVDIEGGLNIRDTQNIQAKFVILYEFGNEDEGVYKAFRVKGYQVKTKEDLIKEGYLNPHHDRYYIYIFDEEVNLGDYDVKSIISADRINYASEIHQSKSLTKTYPEGRPIFLRGTQLLKYRKKL